jgi:hypothetical protein
MPPLPKLRKYKVKVVGLYLPAEEYDVECVNPKTAITRAKQMWRERHPNQGFRATIADAGIVEVVDRPFGLSLGPKLKSPQATNEESVPAQEEQLNRQGRRQQGLRRKKKGWRK